MIHQVLGAALLLFFTCCEAEIRTTTTHTSEPASASLAVKQQVIEDPYFVMPRDTVSAQGPRSITRNMLQARDGMYWFASWEGIIRYDGRIFTNITLKKNLRKFHAFCVLEDKSGNLWFGTIGGGAYKYDGKTFTNFTVKNGLADDAIDCLFEDQSGNIWFGTNKGVSRYNGVSFTNLSMKDGLSSDFVHSIAQDKKGVFWFGTHGGVNYYDGTAISTFKTAEGALFNNVRSIITDQKGNTWIGGQDGFYRYDAAHTNPPVRLSTSFTGYITESKTGEIWLCQGEKKPDLAWNQQDGMALFRYDGRSFKRIIAKNDPDDHQVFGIMEDSSSKIWFGTMNGAWRYDGKTFTNM